MGTSIFPAGANTISPLRTVILRTVHEHQVLWTAEPWVHLSKCNTDPSYVALYPSLFTQHTDVSILS